MSASAGTEAAALLYTAIAKDKKIIVSHAQGTQNATSIATRILDRIDLSSDSKQTFVHQKYQIHYIHTAEDATTYLAMATEALGRRTPFACLFEIKRRWLAALTREHEAPEGDFEPVLRECMALESQQDGGSRAAAAEVQREIDSVKDIMSQNIERVLERGERIDLLVDKSAQLGSSSLAFKKRSQAVKNQMWWQQTRTSALIGVVILLLLYLMIGIGCGLPAWGKCL